MQVDFKWKIGSDVKINAFNVEGLVLYINLKHRSFSELLIKKKKKRLLIGWNVLSSNQSVTSLELTIANDTKAFDGDDSSLIKKKKRAKNEWLKAKQCRMVLTKSFIGPIRNATCIYYQVLIITLFYL